MKIDMEKFEETKKLMIENIKVNYFGYFLYTVIGTLFAYYTSDGSFSYLHYFKSYLTLSFMTWLTWFGHYMLHHHNTYNPIAKIHKYTHHSPFADTFLGKLIEYSFVEFFFFGGGILLILITMIYNNTKVWLFNPYIVLFWAAAVPIIHEIHYHQLEGSKYHEIHHKFPETTYAPEYWDIVFQTKIPDLPIEDETKMLPILIVMTLIMLPLIGTKYDVIKYFTK